MSDIIDTQTSDERAEGLKAWGWVSYVLHPIVAVGAVIPGAQPGAALLIVALVIDLVKKKAMPRAPGRPAIFLAHPHRAVGGRALYVLTAPLWLLFFCRLDRLVPDLDLVPVSHRARMVSMNQSQAIDA